MLAPDITPIVWERHRAERRGPNRYGKPTCEYSINLELGRLKGLLDWAVENEMIRFNPLTAARPVKATSRRETHLRGWDIETLLQAAENVRDERATPEDDDGRRSLQLQAFVLLCFDSMLRFQEARNLRRDLIDPDGNYLVRNAKGGKQRTVTLTPRTLEAIKKVPASSNTHLVFVNPKTGKQISGMTMRIWLRKACEAGKLDARAINGERISAHHLRHAGASAADEGGVRATALMDALGHTNLSVTQRYLHREKTESARHVADCIITATSDRRPPRRIGKEKKSSARD